MHQDPQGWADDRQHLAEAAFGHTPDPRSDTPEARRIRWILTVGVLVFLGVMIGVARILI